MGWLQFIRKSNSGEERSYPKNWIELWAQTWHSIFKVFINPFQFHKGSIKTELLGKNIDKIDSFQFHKGSIKTSVTSLGIQQRCSFNSIKVRLRLSLPQVLSLQINRFNSIKVRLRRGWWLSRAEARISFQFHKGSIKTRLRRDAH